MFKTVYQYKNSVYFLLLKYFLVTVFVMGVVFLSTNAISYSIVKKDTIESHVEKIEFYFKVLEDDIERLTLLQQEYVNDKDLQKMSGQYEIMSDYNRIEAIKSIRHHLSWTNIYSDIIEETSVYMPRINRKISSEKGLIDTKEMDMSFLLDNSIFMNNTIIERNDELLVIVPYYDNSYIKGTPKFVSHFQISDAWLVEQLDNISSLNDSVVVLMQGDSDWFRVSSNNDVDKDRIYEYGQQMIKKSENTPNAIISGDITTVFRYSDKLNLLIYADIPNEIIMPQLRIYRLFMVLFSIVMLTLIILYSRIIYKAINEPLASLVNGMKKVEAGNLDISIESMRQDELGYLIKRFNTMCKRLKETIEQVYEEKLHTRQAELKQLQYQINPHYLYNSLYMIRRMAVSKDTENIEKFSRYLGQYYEYITKINDDRAPLAVEIEHATIYIQVQKMRFGSRIQIELEVLNQKWHTIAVPKLIIHPILENAYNHGLESQRNGQIRLYYIETDRFLEIHVFNSGDISQEKIDEINKRIRKTYTEKTIITGLLNVHRRLQILYGSECGVSLKKVDNGIDVMIKICKSEDKDLGRIVQQNV